MQQSLPRLVQRGSVRRQAAASQIGRSKHVDEEVGINVECQMDGGMYPASVFIAGSAMSSLYCPMEIKARILDCPDSDEHIVRRLGKAVVVLWDSLPAPVQDQLLKQAVLMHDRQRALQLKQKIKAFIKEWKTIE